MRGLHSATMPWLEDPGIGARVCICTFILFKSCTYWFLGVLDFMSMCSTIAGFLKVHTACLRDVAMCVCLNTVDP